jgi:toxin ParE1/3/4
VANKFRKRRQADIDLDSIWSFIAADSVGAADRLIGRLGEAFEMLTTNPLAGRERVDLRSGLRSFAVRNFVIFYYPQLDGIEVVRVIHGRQDIDADDIEP